jgi:hypothetical protein
MSFEVGPNGRANTSIICDRCGADEEFEDGRVHAVADMATSLGWVVKSNDEALCPDCVPAVDDELERVTRDAEIDCRVSPVGDLIDFEAV